MNRPQVEYRVLELSSAMGRRRALDSHAQDGWRLVAVSGNLHYLERRR